MNWKRLLTHWMTAILIVAVAMMPNVAKAAVGDYTGTHWDTAFTGNAGLRGITWDGTYFWATDTEDDEVYKYNADGSSASFSFDTAAYGATNPGGIVFDGTYLWVTDYSLDEVLKFNTSGVYQSSSWDTAITGNFEPRGIVWDGTYFWLGSTTSTVYFTPGTYKHNAAGTYLSVFWSTVGEGLLYFYGLAWDGTYFWAVGGQEHKVYKYNADGSTASFSFDTSTETSGVNSNPYGITYDGVSFWVTDSTDDEVYKYEAPSGTWPPWGEEPVVSASAPFRRQRIIFIR